MKQKAPFLTGFSTDLIGKAKRGAQEAICRFRQSALRESFSGYARLFENVLEPEFLAGLDPTKRNRHFGHLPVFWAWTGQILEHNASCSRGLALIQAWSSGAGTPPPTGDTSAYCQARLRLSIEFLESILRFINIFLHNWRGICCMVTTLVYGGCMDFTLSEGAMKDIESAIGESGLKEKIRRKLLTLRMRDAGAPREMIASSLGLTVRTVSNYLAEYRDGGLKATMEDRAYCPESTLERV